jgi:hypothetical protein
MYGIAHPKAIHIMTRIYKTARQARFLEKQLSLLEPEIQETGGRNGRGTSPARPPVSSFSAPDSEGPFFSRGRSSTAYQSTGVENGH